MVDKDRAGQVVDVLIDNGFTELPARCVAERGNTSIELEQRLRNWARVVGERGRTGGNCSSAWAADYIANRNSKEIQLAMTMGLLDRKSVLGDIEVAVFNETDRLDGWLVEAAWTMLIRSDDKQVLRYRYVMHWSDDQIRQKLRIRGNKNVRLILARAKNCLGEVLEKIKNRSTIRTYNLHAGNPCLSSDP